MFMTIAIYFFPSIINFMRCQKSILNSFSVFVNKTKNSPHCIVNVRTLCGVGTDGENNWKHYKITVSLMAGISNHNLHHPITPGSLLSNEPVFENRWNISTKSMTIDFYDKQPLCVINSRIKKHPALISFLCSPFWVLSIGRGRYVPSVWRTVLAGADWELTAAWLWGYLCYVHWATPNLYNEVL